MRCPEWNLRGAGLLALLVVSLCGCSTPSGGAGGVRIRQLDDRLRVEIDGRLFTEYHYQGASRPYLYPILGPEDLPMTRNWPMQEAPGEERDHPHHRSLWWAHGDVNGVDFWSESDRAGRTVHEKFLELSSGQDSGGIRSVNQLVDREGRRVGRVEYTIRVQRRAEERWLDFGVTVRATEGNLKFGDTKEGTMAIRLNETMRLKPNKDHQGQPTGHIVNNEGVRDGATWGRRAKWVDYHGPVGGRTLGVAIFDHPANPRHPTWWHVRDYGLFAANPFGQHDFEKQPPGTGDWTLHQGETATFRYRFLFHRGDEKEGQVAASYEKFVREPVH